MADYYPLIAKAVAGLDKSTGEGRRILYERARNALVSQLRSITPALSESEITRERIALEEAIRRVEAEVNRRARMESMSARIAKPPSPAAAPAETPSAEPPPGEAAQPKPGADESPAAKPRPGRLAGDRPPLSEQGLKGFRDVVAEAEMLGPATAQAANSARAAFAAVPSPNREFERIEPHMEPEGLRPAPRARTAVRPPAADYEAPAGGEAPGRHDRSRHREGHDREADLREAESLSSELTGRPMPLPGKAAAAQARLRPVAAEEERLEPPPRSYGRFLLIAAVAALVIGLAGVIYMAWPMLAEMAKSAGTLMSSTSAPSAPETTPSSRKFSDRLGSAQEASPGAQQGALVAQRVVLYEEDAADPAGKRYVGSAIWRAETVTAAPGQNAEIVVRAEIDIPERKLGMRWSLRRNTDKSLPASHTVEIMFTLPADFAHGGISSIPGLLMKQSEQTRGIPLAGSAVRVTDGFFLIGLSGLEADVQRNIQLLKERSWFDVPVVYADGKRAILAVEKGTPGERVFVQAFAAWGQ
jgi:hypothetical protein